MARSKKAPGAFERRGRGWRWRVCVGGTRYAFTIRTTDRQAAERWARTKYARLEIEHGRRLDGLPVGLTVADLLDYFEAEHLPRLAPGTQSAYGDSLKPIRTWFEKHGNPTLDRVRAADITAYLDWRRHHRLDGEGPLHPRTLAKDRAVLHRLFALAARLEWRDGNPVTAVPIPRSDGRTPVLLDAGQLDALLAACRTPMVRLFVLLCAETGLRCESEALWLRWEDVDLEQGFLNVVSGRAGHRTKAGRSRAVPLTARLHEELRTHFARYRFAAYEGERPAYLFHHTTTRRHHRAGVRVHSFRDAVGRAAERAKLPPGWRMHDLRHRRATTWLAEGQSPVHVKEALGHADLRTTMAYTHLVPGHLRALVEPRGRGHLPGASAG